MSRTNVRGTQIADGTVDLAVDVTGVLPVANGGSGVASPGSSGNVLTSTGSAWVSAAPAGGTPILFDGGTSAVRPAGSGPVIDLGSSS